MNDPARQTDRELFEAVSRGDAPALAELASRHARGLYDFALRGTLDADQAISVLSTVFQRMRASGTEVPSQIEFRTWLYSLCLVEILAVSNEAHTDRISTEDERFYQRTTDVDLEIAHWSWVAARGLRTRDYCVLDLTLRRGLTPEEVAEAASLTRSNLYASIGRARGAFEETFAAMLLFEQGREACQELDEMVESAPGGGLRPALRHQIIEHSDDCDFCRRTLDSFPPAAGVYISLADVELPEALLRRVLGETRTDLPEPVSESATSVTPGTTATAAAFATGAAALEPPTAGDGGEATEDQAEPESGDVDGLEDVSLDNGAYEEEDEREGDDYAEEDEGLEDEELEDEDEFKPSSTPEPAPVFTREPAPVPVTPIQREEPLADEQPSFGDRMTSWTDIVRGQPLMWTYALLGVAAVIAIYLGVALADSIQSGGGDSGAVPLDTQAGVSAAREIDCGDTPIEMDAGTSTLISFDENALDGYQIKTLSFAPDSEFAKFEDLEATLENPFSIRFVAKQQDTAEARTEQFQLRIQWERGEELASSTCELLVHIKP